MAATNLYEYVFSRPVSFVDPMGLYGITISPIVLISLATPAAPKKDPEACIAGLMTAGTGLAIPGLMCVTPHFLNLWRTQGTKWVNDKRAHCVATCRAAKVCTHAPAIMGSIAKEFLDCLGLGGADKDDIKADVKGLECAGWESTLLWIGPLVGMLCRDDCETCCEKTYPRMKAPG